MRECLIVAAVLLALTVTEAAAVKESALAHSGGTTGPGSWMFWSSQRSLKAMHPLPRKVILEPIADLNSNSRSLKNQAEKASPSSIASSTASTAGTTGAVKPIPSGAASAVSPSRPSDAKKVESAAANMQERGRRGARGGRRFISSRSQRREWGRYGWGWGGAPGAYAMMNGRDTFSNAGWGGYTTCASTGRAHACSSTGANSWWVRR
eukprot:gene2382-2686_t